MKYLISSFKKLKDHDDWRWDGEFLCFEPIYNDNYRYVKIGDFLKYSQYGISIDMNEEHVGYKIYRMDEIDNMFCNRHIDKYADVGKAQAKKFILNNNDVLFNRTNSQAFVGRTGIYKKFSDDEILFASYLIRVVPDENKILPEYLTIFLNTKHGVQDIKRRARISINQSNVNAEELKRILIPLLSIPFQTILRKIFNTSFNLICEGEYAYSKAEQLLLSELGLLGWKPEHQKSFIKNYFDTATASRIDAEYFQPMYDEIINRSKEKVHTLPVNDIFYFKRGDFIDTKYYSQEKTKRAYIRIKELSNIKTIDETQVIYIDDNFNNVLKNTLKENDIVMAIIGDTIGKSNLILKDYEGSYFSNNTGRFRLRPNFKKQFNPFYLEILFHSIFIQSQVQRAKAQTGQPKIANDEINKIVIPLIDLAKQEEIGNYVLNGIINTKLSKKLLDIAKRGVEMAIEQDENSAEYWIKSEIEDLGIDIDT